MQQDLAWLGLTFDGTVRQSMLAKGHHTALDTLARLGLLYACHCSRGHIAQYGRLTGTGERIYHNACRASPRLSPAQWRDTTGALRVQVDGLPSDPVVRRRDGSVAYLLACVVDDAAMGITHVVRGRDLLNQEPIQKALGQLLGLPIPSYQHHLLLLEPRGGKLAKLHGSLPASQLTGVAPAEAWLGALSYLAGLRTQAEPTTAMSLLSDFDWSLLRQDDRVVSLEGGQLWVGTEQATESHGGSSRHRIPLEAD